MRLPLVSVLVPVYNRGDLLGPCVRSALRQTMGDLEVVIVDNASTDHTWQVCEELADSDCRVRIFQNQTNIGPVLNWKRCLDEAKGVYGKILFSDDLMSDQFLEKTLKYLHEDVGFVFSIADIGSHPGGGNHAYKWARNSVVFPSKDYISAALLSGGVPVSPCAALFRLDDLRKNLVLDRLSANMDDFLKYGAGIDLLLYLLTAKSYPNIAYVNECLVFFRSHSGSITIARGDELWDFYTRARLWFAKECETPDVVGKCLALSWIEKCRRKKMLLNPTVFARQYLGNTELIDARYVAWALVAKLKRKMTAWVHLSVTKNNAIP